MHILTSCEEEVDEQLVRIKMAQVEHKVIGEHMFTKRICGSNIIQIPERCLFVPFPGPLGALRQLLVTCCAKLTWCRPPSNSTHETTFNLVPTDVLDIDVLHEFHNSG